MSEKISELIQRRLVELNITKAELAKRTGVSRAYIGDLANGTAKTQSGFYRPKPEVLKNLAEALQVEENQILNAIGYAATETEKPKPPVTVAEFYEALKKLGIETKFGKGELEKLPASDLPELLETLITLTLGKIGRTEHGKTFSASDDPRSKAA